MLEQFSEKVVNSLILNGCIRHIEKERYTYGLFCLIEYFISSLSILTIGILTGKVLQTIIFMLAFVGIKKRSGGLHASTYLRCMLGGCMIYMLFVFWLERFMLEHMWITLLSLMISFALLEIIGAVRHPAICWSEMEYQKSISASRMITLLEFLIISTLYCLHADVEIWLYMTFALILNAVLLAIAKIKEELKHEKTFSEESNIGIS